MLRYPQPIRRRSWYERRVPDEWEGPLSEYIDTFVVPNLPSGERLAAWISAVLAHHAGPDPIFLVRGPRKGSLARELGSRVAHTDNSPGIWCWLRALDGDFDPKELGAAIEQGTVPVLAALKGRDKRDWDWDYAKKALAKRDSGRFWNRDLKHCHIHGLKASAGTTLKQRAIRNICPANHFPFPNGHDGSKFITERIGWHDGGPRDLGESDRVIGWVQHRIRSRLGADVGLHDRFLAVIGAPAAPTAPPPDGQIRVARAARTRGTARPQPRHEASLAGDRAAPQRVSASPSRPVAPARAGVATARRWTLNAKHGYYVKTGESADLIEVALAYRDARGAVSDVGRFRLDLGELATRGVVTRRGDVFDIKVTREPSGRFVLGVRQSPSLPLDRFRVP